MKVNSREYRRDCESQRGSVLAMFARRLKSLESRYPSEAQSLLSILDQAIVSGTSFISAAMIGRLTTPDELGLYYLVLSIVLIIAAVEDCVVTAPYLVYSRQRENRELMEYSGSVWFQHLVLCAMSTAVWLAIIAIESIAGQPRFLPGPWVLLGVTPLILLRHAFRRMAIANLHIRSAIALDTAVAAVQLGGFALLGFFGTLSLASIFAVMGGACGLACIGLYLIDPPTIRFVRQRFLPDWRSNWAFAKWALRSNLVGSATPYLLLWILGLTAGTTAAGVYGACNTLVGVTGVLLTGVSNVLTQQSAHVFFTEADRGLRRFLLRTAAWLVLALGGVCLVIAMTGDWLAVLVFGPHFQGTGGILLTLAFSALVASLGHVAGCGLWAVDEPRKNYVGAMYGMAVTLVMAALLVSPLGVLGAALSTLAGMTASAVAQVIMLQRFLSCTAVGKHATSLDFAIRADAQSGLTQSADMPDTRCEVLA